MWPAITRFSGFMRLWHHIFRDRTGDTQNEDLSGLR
jgi:hypothetical protein